jgi:thiamine pyrophosphokinase
MKTANQIKKGYSERFKKVGIQFTSVKTSKTEGYDFDIKHLKCGDGWVSSNETSTQIVDETQLEHWVSNLEENEFLSNQ